MKYSSEHENTKTALFTHVCGEELKKQLRTFDRMGLMKTVSMQL